MTIGAAMLGGWSVQSRNMRRTGGEPARLDAHRLGLRGLCANGKSCGDLGDGLCEYFKAHAFDPASLSAGDHGRPVFGVHPVARPHLLGRVLTHSDVVGKIGKAWPKGNDLCVFHVANKIHFVPQVNTDCTAQMNYFPAMEIHERLKLAREQAGFEQPSEAARHFGWSEHTYKSHENGTRGIRLPVAQKYAEAFGVSVAWLTTGTNGPERNIQTAVLNVPVYGAAAGGVWLENADDPETDEFVPISPDPRYPAHAQYARLVKGTSVSNRIQNGEFAIVVRFEAYPGAVPNDTLVDVERIRSGLREHTIKVFRLGKLYTDDATKKQQSELPIEHTDGDTETRIAGIVIGAFRPL